MLTDPPHILRRLKVDKASLVDAPANEGAKILLAKRRHVSADGEPATRKGGMKKAQPAGQLVSAGERARRLLDAALDSIERSIGVPREDALRVAFRRDPALAIAAGFDEAHVLAQAALAVDDGKVVGVVPSPLSPGEADKMIGEQRWGRACEARFDALSRAEMAKTDCNYLVAAERVVKTEEGKRLWLEHAGPDKTLSCAQVLAKRRTALSTGKALSKLGFTAVAELACAKLKQLGGGEAGFRKMQAQHPDLIRAYEGERRAGR